MYEYQQPDPEQPSSVAAYIGKLNKVLAGQQGRVKGEVTSAKQTGKAIYFTIKDKDDQAKLDCLVWVSTYQMMGVKLNVGDEIIVTGYPDIYAPYGKFSFKASTIEYAGEGALKQAYDKLKAALAHEGMFARDRKRPLPALPTKIGLITSMSGVVIQDFTTNLSRHGFNVMTVDSRVEGKDAIHDLLAALRTMSKQDIEVLVIMRGGGSWESLQAFNTESVVRAIANFKVPVITGIGHDVDVTLSEMVADIGRSTPTAVAQAINEPWDGLASSVELLQRETIGAFSSLITQESTELDDSTHRIFRLYERQLATARTTIGNLSTTLSSLFTALARRIRDANAALLRATGIMKSNIRMKRTYLEQLPGKLQQHTNTAMLKVKRTMREDFSNIARRQQKALQVSNQSMIEYMNRAAKGQGAAISRAKQLLPSLERVVSTNDPKRTMRLGYSLSYSNGKLIRAKADIAPGETVTTTLLDGQFTSEVKRVE